MLNYCIRIKGTLTIILQISIIVYLLLQHFDFDSLLIRGTFSMVLIKFEVNIEKIVWLFAPDVVCGCLSLIFEGVWRNVYETIF